MAVHVDVCIVGAGPSGVLLGYLLAKNGVSTMVVERTSGRVGAFRGEHINAESEEILKAYNLFHQVEQKGLLKMNRVEYVHQGHIIKMITSQDSGGHVGIHVPQANLIGAIVEEAQKLANFQLLYNATVTNLLVDESGKYAGVKVRTEDGVETIHSSIIVGADGRFSTVRKLANIPFEKVHHGYDVLWAKVPAPLGWEPTVRMIEAYGQQLALFTQAGGYIQIGWNIKEGSFPTVKNTPFSMFIKPLLDNFPELREQINNHLRSWRDVICFHVHSSKCSTWVKDGLVLIGDAAHTMTPTGAIGVNAGLKDASLLAPIIIQAIHSGEYGEEILKKFEHTRRDEIEQQQHEQILKEQLFKENFYELPVV